MLARGVGLRQQRRHAYERRLPLRVHDGDAAQLENTAVPVWAARALPDFALRNDDGTLDMVRTGYDLDFEATGDTVPSDDFQASSSRQAAQCS